MKESLFITLLAGVLMLIMAVYIFILLDYRNPYILIVVGLIGLVYLMMNVDNKK